MTRKRVDAFLQLAGEELEAANRLRTVLPRQSMYFLQQTVEKLIRAVLESEEIAAGVGHNLLMVAGLLPKEHPLRARFEAFEHLSAASTRYRYPSGTGALHVVSTSDVEREFFEVGDLLREVVAFLVSASRRT